MIYELLRPALFALPAELTHDLTLSALTAAHRLGLVGGEAQRAEPRQVMGLRFPNPVGLAAGLDKNADHIDALGALGFGFIEVGTVTPRPQPGNPKPRMFRLPEQQALINRMGFNNKGVDHLVARLQHRRYPGVVGVNIGKNKDTPAERAVEDYLHGLRKVYAVADYVVVNISSPNTPGLRDLQQAHALDALLEPLKEAQARLAQWDGRRVPLVVKIAPDMADSELDLMAERLQANAVDGVIATNTTVGRSGVEHTRHAGEQGGLSGAPLRERAQAVLEKLRGRMPGTAMIGVGGICSGGEAVERLSAGADLIQLYTGLIYRGPGLIDEAVKAANHPGSGSPQRSQ